MIFPISSTQIYPRYSIIQESAEHFSILYQTLYVESVGIVRSVTVIVVGCFESVGIIFTCIQESNYIVKTDFVFASLLSGVGARHKSVVKKIGRGFLADMAYPIKLILRYYIGVSAF